MRRGEAVAEVTATGARTKFGRTAELVRTAHVESSQQKAVLRVVRNLAMVNGVIIVMLVGYAYVLKMPLERDHSPGAHGDSGVDSGSVAGHLHSCGGARRAGSGTSWAFFQPGSPRWMKRPASTCCARTRPAR